MLSSKLVRVVSLAMLVLLVGCARNQEANREVGDTTAVTPTPPSGGTEAVPAWVAQLRQGESEMGTIVEEGRLGEVHDQAAKLQSILKQAADQGGSLTPVKRQELSEHVAMADRLADELHDAADAGDLTKTKAKYQEFKAHLRAVEGVFGVAAP